MLSFKELLAVDYTQTDKDQQSKNAKKRKVDEGRTSQRHPLEGHPYHSKSNAALIYIAKDARKAADAMKGHNTDAENKYADQANDSATVRYWRQKNGTPDWYKKKYNIKEQVESVDEEVEMIDEDPDLTEEEIGLLEMDEAVLNPAQRARKKQLLRRNKAKIQIGRIISSRRLASKATINKRAKRRARGMIMKKLLKNRSKGSLSYSARAGYERLLNKRKVGIDRLTVRIKNKVRKDDINKLRSK